MHLFPKTHFDFLKYRGAYFAFSGLLLAASAASVAMHGVRYGIDFTGGTAVQVSFDKDVHLDHLRDAVEKAGAKGAAIQHYTGTNIFMIRIPSESGRSAESLEKDLAAMAAGIPEAKMTVDSKMFVGPSVGRHLFRQALWAIFLSLAGIILYLAFRFANPVWGVAGIIALFHDIFATYGLFSILGLEVDLLIISAILTIGGYSIHDTIIVFDRMREKMRHMRRESLDLVMNESINETLSRTVITSGTIFVVVSILYVFGGPVIHHFALAMVFGCIVGTYSSIAVAVPFVYEWSRRGHKISAAPAPAPEKTKKR